jgi:hypothetical protein
MAVIEAIATTYLEADAASVTFSGIPATYEHLQLRFSAAANTTGIITASLLFNADTTASNYYIHSMRGFASSTNGLATTGGAPTMFAFSSAIPAASYNTAVVDILDYANSNKNTTTAGVRGAATDVDTYGKYVEFVSGLWMSTAVVSSVVFQANTGSFVRGSEFTLYGLNSA